MIYFDTNVVVYAFSNNVDNVLQKNIAFEYVREAVKEKKFLISEVVLCEYAFIAKKIKEENINEIIDFLSKYIIPSNYRVINNLNIYLKKGFYKNSFDIYHLAYATEFAKKIVTFDKDFVKFKKFSNIEIEILRSEYED
ncbi:MAG: type II toxin-antitoxin system VapC family toxin [Epsilonproteobacteria bacterium]|nr:type II toxin-antitoxin system VapC family toxin [Campylobacterota bacterium]